MEFHKEKEYARVLKDDVRLLELVRSGADEDDLFSEYRLNLKIPQT